MKNTVLTISREFGSGGRTIAREVAEKLGFAYYDNELVTEIAAKSGFDVEFIKSRGEEASFTNSFLYNLSMNYNLGTNKTSVEDQLYIAQFHVIKELALKENCVIVGRCSDYILQTNPLALHVHIHGDKEARAKRIVEVYGETQEQPEKRIKDKDKRRKAYYERYTSRKWGDIKNYHICLDSSKLGIDPCVDILVKAMKG